MIAPIIILSHEEQPRIGIDQQRPAHSGQGQAWQSAFIFGQHACCPRANEGMSEEIHGENCSSNPEYVACAFLAICRIISEWQKCQRIRRIRIIGLCIKIKLLIRPHRPDDPTFSLGGVLIRLIPGKDIFVEGFQIIYRCR